jgi:hypothetical protein
MTIDFSIDTDAVVLGGESVDTVLNIYMGADLDEVFENVVYLETSSTQISNFNVTDLSVPVGTR